MPIDDEERRLALVDVVANIRTDVHYYRARSDPRNSNAVRNYQDWYAATKQRATARSLLRILLGEDEADAIFEQAKGPSNEQLASLDVTDPAIVGEE